MHGFLRTFKGGKLNFTTRDVSGAKATYASGINNKGQIVGWGEYGDYSGINHGFLRDTDGSYSTIDFPGITSYTKVCGINDNGQIVGEYWDGSKMHGFVATPLRLLVVIPGINDHGEKMIEGAKFIVDYDDECTIRICEKQRNQICDLVKPSPEQVHEKIVEALENAREKGKDIVVLIDMDLENYSLDYLVGKKWRSSVRWGGRMANIVSEAFSNEVSGGMRIIYAHSAGGDATYQSIYKSGEERMYDNINIFNGRTSANALKSALKRSDYQWWQVKVFTNNGDCPGNPAWNLSNHDVVKKPSFAGDVWVHIHCRKIKTCPKLRLSFCKCHSVLRDSIPKRTEVTFEVNFGSLKSREIVTGKVDEMMLMYWSQP